MAHSPTPGTDGSELADDTPPQTILVVEDSETILLVIVSVLRKCGWEVLAAADGEEAIELAAGHPGTLDLIVCDVTLPGIQGPEATTRILVGHPETTVLFVSGDHLDPTEFDIPGARFLAKPFKVDDLVDAVRAALAA